MIDILDYLKENNIEYKENKRGFLLIETCVNLACGKKNKMYVHVSDDKYQNGFVNCFSCGIKGGFEKFIAANEGIETDIAYARMNSGEAVEKDNSIVDQSTLDVLNSLSVVFTTPEETSYDFIQNAKEFALEELSSALIDPPALEYLLKRGLTQEDILNCGILSVPVDNKIEMRRVLDNIPEQKKDWIYRLFKMKVNPNDKDSGITDEEVIEGYNKIKEINLLAGRVIFPVQIGKKIIGYVARDYTGESKIKVLNSSGPMTSDFFWNYNNTRTSENLYILEGIFSAVSCGIKSSIALLGKNAGNLNSNRYKIFSLMKFKKAYVYLDVGAYSEAQSICSNMQAYCDEVYFVIPPTVLKLIGSIDERKINDCNIFYTTITDRKIYMTYEDQQACKFAAKIAETKDPLKKKMIMDIINKGTHDLKKKVNRIIVKLGFDDDCLKSIKVIAQSDFLDANDLGLEINQKILGESTPYLPYIDYSYLSKSIQKLP